MVNRGTVIMGPKLETPNLEAKRAVATMDSIGLYRLFGITYVKHERALYFNN